MGIKEDSTLAAISNTQLFRSLDEEGRNRLLQTSTQVSFEPDQVIVREGDPGEALFLIKSGSVRVFTIQEGQEVQLASLSRGACFGEVALLSGRARTATVVATEPSTLLCFHRQHIDEVLDEYPKVRKLLESIVIGRAKDTIEKLVRAPAQRPAE